MSDKRLLLLGAVAVLSICVTAPLVGLTEGTGCARSDPTDLQHDDGRWLVLKGWGCAEGNVFLYNSQWRREGTINVENRINTSDGGYHDIILFERTKDGGWWSISKGGRAYQLSSDFRYENRTRQLPFDRVDIDSGEDLTGFAIDNRGYWWITMDRKTIIVDSADNQTLRRFGRGANDIAIRNDRVFFLRDGRKGGVVQEYDIRESPEGKLTLHERAKHELGPEVFHPTVLSRGPNGRWWVYSRYDDAFAYDQNWQYTGERHHSSTVIHGLFFLSPALFVSLVGLWYLSWQVMMDYRPKRLLVIYVGLGTLAVVLSVSLRQSLVPSPLAFIYWPSDSLVAAMLLAPTVIGTYLLEKRSWSRVILVVMATLPLFVVSWDFLTSTG